MTFMDDCKALMPSTVLATPGVPNDPRGRFVATTPVITLSGCRIVDQARQVRNDAGKEVTSTTRISTSTFNSILTVSGFRFTLPADSAGPRVHIEAHSIEAVRDETSTPIAQIINLPQEGRTVHSTASEKSKYDKVWARPEYRTACHSARLWEQRRDLFPVFNSALDIGCGLGALLDIWNDLGIDAWGVDISEACLHRTLKYKHKVVFACLWEMEWDRQFDLGICTDVMEHVPEDRVSDTLSRIAQCCGYVLFKIAHVPNELGGEVLHLTLEPAKWWLDTMIDVGGHAEYLGVQMRSGYRDSLIGWHT